MCINCPLSYPLRLWTRLENLNQNIKNVNLKKPRILGPQADIGGSDIEDDDNERTELIPGTLDHINELMVEKDIRVRVPLQELEVLLEPI